MHFDLHVISVDAGGRQFNPFPQKAGTDTFDNSDLYRDVRVLGTNSKDCNVFSTASDKRDRR
jgi:hypothetical protein